jgi:hypothetical protein
MGNTLLAEREPEIAEYPLPSERAPKTTRRLEAAVPRRSRTAALRLLRDDWLIVAVLLVCMFTICTLGVIYVSAFANVAWQAQKLATTNQLFANASAQNEALLRENAYLQSENRIAPRATVLKMSQSAADALIEVLPSEPQVGRQVASAQ